MALLIDSSVFIGMERRGLRIDDFRRIGPDEPAFMASITASELLVGVLRATPSPRATARGDFVERLCHVIPIIPFDLMIARVHARLWTSLAAAGTPIGPADLIIAATAVAQDHAILTDNAREFRRVSGLIVIEPTWPE